MCLYVEIADITRKAYTEPIGKRLNGLTDRTANTLRVIAMVVWKYSDVDLGSYLDILAIRPSSNRSSSSSTRSYLLASKASSTSLMLSFKSIWSFDLFCSTPLLPLDYDS